MNAPRFSIIMPTYNRGYCIANAIDSILDQTYQAFELIIIDDGSTDNTKQLIFSKYKSEIDSKKIIYVQNTHNGVSYARNTGLKTAKYEWIAYLDTDNTYLNTNLGVYAYEIMHNSSYMFFYGKIIYNESSIIMGKQFNEVKLHQDNYIDINAVCHAKKLYTMFGGFDDSLDGLEDYDLILTYSKYTIPYFINFILINYDNSPNKFRVTNSKKTTEDDIKNKHKYNNYNESITTIITSYNQEKYILNALQSAFDQDIDNNIFHQIIVTDDASTDKTHEIISEFISTHNKPNIEWLDISSEKNIGLKENLSKCIKYIKGTYVALLEGDDYWFNNKLSTCLHFMQDNRDCTMCFSKLQMKNYLTNSLYPELLRQKDLSSKLTGADICKSECLNPICNLSTCVFKSNIFRTFPIFNKYIKFRHSEISLSLYFEQFGYIGYINTVLSIYGIHENSQWTNKSLESKRQQFSDDIDNAILVSSENCKKFLIQNKDNLIKNM